MMASPDVAPTVHRRDALACELHPLSVPGFAREPPDLQRAVARRFDPALEHPRCGFGVLGDEVALERHQHRALLFEGQALGHVDLSSIVGLEHAGSSLLRAATGGCCRACGRGPPRAWSRASATP